MLKSVIHRIHRNFLMRSRLPYYETLLQSLKDRGYQFLTIPDLAAGAKSGHLPDLSCVIRTDVDTDTATAAAMFEIERKLEVRASYYFRLSTIDTDLMRRIFASGSEVGYHYEELATVCKRSGLKDKADVDAYLPAIRDEFAADLEYFAACLGRMPVTICSHGDWMNRRIGIPNHYIIDAPLRRRYALIAEAYDEWLNAPVAARFSDVSATRQWNRGAPEEAIARRARCIYILLHPRQWRANPLENLRLDVERAGEYALFRARSAVAPRSRESSFV